MPDTPLTMRDRWNKMMEWLTPASTPQSGDFTIMAVATEPELSQLRYALVRDAGFVSRLEALLAQIAFQVLAEDPGTEPRKTFAKKVLATPRVYAERCAMYLVQTDNFAGETIIISPMGSGFAVEITTSDAAAVSQIFTKWDDLASLFGA